MEAPMRDDPVSIENEPLEASSPTRSISAQCEILTLSSDDVSVGEMKLTSNDVDSPKIKTTCAPIRPIAENESLAILLSPSISVSSDTGDTVTLLMPDPDVAGQPSETERVASDRVMETAAQTPPGSPKISTRRRKSSAHCSSPQCSTNTQSGGIQLRKDCCRFCGGVFCLNCLTKRVRGLRACASCFDCAPESEKWTPVGESQSAPTTPVKSESTRLSARSSLILPDSDTTGRPRTGSSYAAKPGKVASRQRSSSESHLKNSTASEGRDCLGFKLPPQKFQPRKRTTSFRRVRSGEYPSSRRSGKRIFSRGQLTKESMTSVPENARDIRERGWDGIDPEIRGYVWYHASGGRSLRKASTSTYSEYCTKSSTLAAGIQQQISLDIPRTFADCHDRFDPEKPGCLLPVLNRVLLAATVFLEEKGIRYWQGFNFIVGFILLIVENEETAFWIFNGVMSGALSAIFSTSAGPNVEVMLVDEIVSERLLNLHKIFSSMGIPLRTYTMKWMICGFTSTLPGECSVRFWDLIIFSSANLSDLDAIWPDETNFAVKPDTSDTSYLIVSKDYRTTGSNILILLCVSVLSVLKNKIVSAQSPGEINDVMKTSMACLTDAELVFETALDICGGDRQVFSPSWSMHVEFQAIRRRASTKSSHEGIKLKKLRKFRSVFAEMRSQNSQFPHLAGSSKGSAIEVTDFVNIFRSIYVPSLEQDLMKVSGDELTLEDWMWVPEGEAFFRMIDDDRSGGLSQKEFIAMATAFPHIMHHFECAEEGDGCDSEPIYMLKQLHTIFEKFDVDNEGTISKSEFFTLLRNIHLAAGRYNNASWANEIQLQKVSLTSISTTSVSLSDQALHKYHCWVQEINLIFAWTQSENDTMSFNTFCRCAVEHPTLGIGMCLLRTQDAPNLSGTKKGLNEDLIIEAHQEISSGTTMIRRTEKLPSGDASSQPFMNCLLSQVDSGSHRLFASISYATYVPSSSRLESIRKRGHVVYTVVVTSEVSRKEKECNHWDFIKLRENLVDDYPKETRLDQRVLDTIKSFPIPAKPLDRFQPEQINSRRLHLAHFLDIVQSNDAQRIRVCLASLVE